MWRSLTVIVLAFALSACGYHLEADTPEAGPAAAQSTPAPVDTAAATPTQTPPVATTVSAPAEPTAIDSGVIHEYCVRITFDTHFRPGTQESAVRTFADGINQRLCVDGHPRSGTTTGKDRMQDGQEIEWSAQFL
jgi:hypothetical protein